MGIKFRIVAVIIVAAAIAMCFLLIISVDLSGVEPCRLTIRGYNLIEFSALGCVPILAPLFIPIIPLEDTFKNSYMVCYVHSINDSKAWIASISISPINYHRGIAYYPAALAVDLVIAKIMSVYVKCEDVGVIR